MFIDRLRLNWRKAKGLQLIQFAETLSGMIEVPLEKDFRIIDRIANDSDVVDAVLMGDYGFLTKR